MLGYEGGVPLHHLESARTLGLSAKELAAASSIFVATAQRYLELSDEQLMTTFGHRHLLVDPREDATAAAEALKERVISLGQSLMIDILHAALLKGCSHSEWFPVQPGGRDIEVTC